MTAAEESRLCFGLLGCAGQVSDAVSACTRVKTKDGPTLSRLPMSARRDTLMRLSRNKRPGTWQSIEELVDPRERDLYDHTLAELLWERQLEKVLFTNGWVDSTNLRTLFRA